MKLFKTILVTALLSNPLPALAGVDAPGQVWLELLAADGPSDLDPTAPPDGLPTRSIGAEAYFSTDASAFGRQGVLIWTAFELSGPDGPRHATLLMDLAIVGARLGKEHPLNQAGIAVEYFERRGDRIVFEGRAEAVEVHLVGFSDDGGDGGAVEGRFGLVLSDVRGAGFGSRTLLAGGFLTDPAPRQQATTGGRVDAWDDGEEVVVESGCGLDDTGDTWDEQDSDEEMVDSGCDGDTWDDDDDDEDWDDGDDSDWEGDTWDDDDDDWEGDTFDQHGQGLSSASGGDSGPACAIGAARRRADPLRGLLRFIPELTGLAFIGLLRRRRRR